MMYKGATAGPVVKLFSEAELIKSCVPAFITKNFLVLHYLLSRRLGLSTLSPGWEARIKILLSSLISIIKQQFILAENCNFSWDTFSEHLLLMSMSKDCSVKSL